MRETDYNIEEGEPAFQGYMRLVDGWLWDDHQIPSHRDLPDCPYFDWWENGNVTPRTAAKRAARNG